MPKTVKKKKAMAVSKTAKKKPVSLKSKVAGRLKKKSAKAPKAAKPAKAARAVAAPKAAKSSSSKSSGSIRSAKATVVSKPAPIVKPPKPARIVPADDRFNARDLKDIREKLLGILAELQNEIKHEVNSASERDLTQLMDTSDIANDSAEGELAIRIAESEGVEAAEVQKAIDKIDAGTYGICERCNKPINSERLKFKPFASMCIKCQEIAEIRRDNGDDELDEFAPPSEEVLEES